MKSFIYLFSLGLLFASCNTLDDPSENVNVNDVIRLSAFYQNSTSSAYTISADGNSQIEISAVLGEQMKPNQAIEFSTTHGLLALPGQPISEGKQTLTVNAAYREAIVVLYSGNAVQEKVVVSAKVGNFSNVMNVGFTTAYPELVNVGPDFVSAATGDTASINLTASRNSGVVSEGVTYHISTAAPDSIPLNVPEFGILNGQTSQFKITNPLGKTGVANVRIAIPIAADDSIVRTIQLIYQ